MEKCVICISEKTCETERHSQRDREREKRKKYEEKKII